MTKLIPTSLLVLVLIATALSAGELSWYEFVGTNGDSPYGLISWTTDMKLAQTKSRQSGNPILHLAGSETDAGKRFARNALSFFYIVDGTEAFIPVRTTGDQPRLEFLSNTGEVLIKSLKPSASIGEVMQGMVQALAASGSRAPEYLRMAAISEVMARVNPRFRPTSALRRPLMLGGSGSIVKVFTSPLGRS